MLRVKELVNLGVDIIGPSARAKDARRVLPVSRTRNVSVSPLNFTWSHKATGAVPDCLDLLYAQDRIFLAVGNQPLYPARGSPVTAPCRYCNLAPTDGRILHRLIPEAVLLTTMTPSVAVFFG